MRTIHHHWTRQPGFKVDKCSTCGVVRRYDIALQRVVYDSAFVSGLYLAPNCKTVYHNDLLIVK
jgi:hypothetical protein